MKTLKIISLFIVSFSFFYTSCEKDEDIVPGYRQEMKNFVQSISKYAKKIDSSFLIIPQNGQELVTLGGNEDGLPDTTYLNAIDGVGREDLFYGYYYDNEPTPEGEILYMTAFLDICEKNDVEVLTTDYCWTHNLMDDSYAKNNAKGYISFAAANRELDQIPDYPQQPYNVNSNNINTLSSAQNFLYLLNPENYQTKQDFINALSSANFDILLIDYFFNEQEFSPEEILSLKTKQNGGSRLVIAYMSIGEAEDYRYYWESDWDNNPPEWIAFENADWPGNYVVKYWNKDWQNIIFGNKNSYLKKILDAGFDGVYLDIIDAFEYFE